MCRRACSGSFRMSMPSTWSDPCVGRISVAAIFRNVVLAGAIATEQCDEFAPGNLKADAAERNKVSELFLDVLRFQCQRGFHQPSCDASRFCSICPICSSTFARRSLVLIYRRLNRCSLIAPRFLLRFQFRQFFHVLILSQYQSFAAGSAFISASFCSCRDS